MSVLEMKVPSPGESISEVEIAEWMVEDGDYVEKDQTIAEVDSDKAHWNYLPNNQVSYTLKAEVGDVVAVGQVVCHIDTSATKPEGNNSSSNRSKLLQHLILLHLSQVHQPTGPKSYAAGHPSVAAKKIMDEQNVQVEMIEGTGKGGRITKQDILQLLAAFPKKEIEKSDQKVEYA